MTLRPDAPPADPVAARPPAPTGSTPLAPPDGTGETTERDLPEPGAASDAATANPVPGEPTGARVASGAVPIWVLGTFVAAFGAVLAAVAMMALTESLAGHSVVAVGVDVVVGLGVAPALWLCRDVPVARWLALGVAVGVVIGWFGSLAAW